MTRVRRVFVHIGLPKTGTSYLQAIVWPHRDALRAAGLLLPGRERRDHLWASLVVREDPHVARRNPRAPEAWDVLRREIAAWDGDALISHEFFCSATTEPRRGRWWPRSRTTAPRCTWSRRRASRCRCSPRAGRST